jgi:hypothetical protein
VVSKSLARRMLRAPALNCSVPGLRVVPMIGAKPRVRFGAVHCPLIMPDRTPPAETSGDVIHGHFNRWRPTLLWLCR